ncbi:hypothetical protein ES319_D04G129000v1 [Gossypium barbadense]|uniref:Uncharacterized protein n=2 Tax=Gossypium TaxID=3633 RepID=A0A5J5RUU3_GOSBA|nr:hypothetical protein ES319_D04G129000v1 [Gossypium barbadense]TYG73886.1 hypothetical protein ES288_D04G137700v1 [Gossypium darwinii]
MLPNSRGSNEEAMLSFTSVLEKLLKDHAGKYATGDEVSMICF